MKINLRRAKKKRGEKTEREKLPPYATKEIFFSCCHVVKEVLTEYGLPEEEYVETLTREIMRVIYSTGGNYQSDIYPYAKTFISRHLSELWFTELERRIKEKPSKDRYPEECLQTVENYLQAGGSKRKALALIEKYYASYEPEKGLKYYSLEMKFLDNLRTLIQEQL